MTSTSRLRAWSRWRTRTTWPAAYRSRRNTPPEVGEFARRNGLILHIDGARIFNAAAAYAVDVKELVADADSATFCLSKGLCAPVGSVLVGNDEFIRRARRARKALGGSLRQAGVLASAGLIALHEMTDRLIEDHRNAQLLAEGLSEIPGVRIHSQHTNFVFLALAADIGLSLDEFVRLMWEKYNIRMSPYGGEAGDIRLRTHYWIDQPAIELTLKAVRVVLS